MDSRLQCDSGDRKNPGTPSVLGTQGMEKAEGLQFGIGLDRETSVLGLRGWKRQRDCSVV